MLDRRRKSIVSGRLPAGMLFHKAQIPVIFHGVLSLTIRQQKATCHRKPEGMQDKRTSSDVVFSPAPGRKSTHGLLLMLMLL